MTRPQLDDKQRNLLTGLVQHSSIRAAAAAVGIPEATAYRISKDPQFQAARKEVGRMLLSHALIRLQAEAIQAVQVLADIAADPKVHPRDRTAAAGRLLDHAKKIAEVTDVLDLELTLDRLKADYGNVS